MENVTNSSSFLTFIGSFIDSIIDAFKLLFTFFQNLFNPQIYRDIFNYLPQPFNFIMLSLVSLIFVLIIMFMLDKFRRLL